MIENVKYDVNREIIFSHDQMNVNYLIVFPSILVPIIIENDEHEELEYYMGYNLINGNVETDNVLTPDRDSDKYIDISEDEKIIITDAVLAGHVDIWKLLGEAEEKMNK